MSPRRSSRARTTGPAPGPPPHTNSSTSTASLTRADRNTRSNNRLPSPKRSSTQRSDSVEDAESARVESLAPRRSRRGNDIDKEGNSTQPDEDEQMEGTEEEVTRCICGNAEYPGPPASIRESKPPQDPVTDDLGNFFVQCDHCQVWQHGGCMGFTDEDQLPDKYYCELCKPELHRTIRGSNGSKSSRYLPLHHTASSRSSSLSSAAEQLVRKDSKGKLIDAATKRRATLNSRVAYDEEEALRRAIEESREMGSLGKRARDESEDVKQIAKRQRTSSSADSESPRGRSRSPGTEEPSNGKGTSNGSKSAHRMRGAAARNHREKEMRDQLKEQAAAQRAEAANKRQARSERRRVDESPVPTPSLSPSKATSIHTAPKTNDPSPSHKAQSNNLRRGGRPSAKRGRIGRNQYTRDFHLNGDSDIPHRDASHDPNGNSGSPGHNGISGESGRSSKAKTHPARTSMNEMKRRVAAILEFVNRMQVERPANTSGSASSSNKGGTTPNGTSSAASSGVSLPTATLIRAVEAGLKDVNENDGEGPVAKLDNKNFPEMDSGEMMESLTRELVGWQSVYGKYGEK